MSRADASKVSDVRCAAKLSYTIDQAADAIGISRSSIYEEIKDGGLWTFKAKGRTLILREVLVDWLDRQVQLSHPASGPKPGALVAGHRPW